MAKCFSCWMKWTRSPHLTHLLCFENASQKLMVHGFMSINSIFFNELCWNHLIKLLKVSRQKC